MEKEFETILYKAIAERGKDFLNNTSLCKAILNDYCKGQYKKEINVLVGAIEGRYKEKLAVIREELLSVQLPILAEHFHDEYGYSKELCIWSLKLLSNTNRYDNNKQSNISIKKIEYLNGDIYEGEILNDLPHGQGTYIWSNGDVYKGCFVEGCITGVGKRIWSDGNTYEGSFLNGTEHGKGKISFLNGTIYEGNFFNGQLKGFGNRIYRDGEIEHGWWTDGEFRKITKKTICYPSGTIYEGETKDNIEHGKGRYTWLNGDVYEGDFVEGYRTGKGAITWSNGDAYEGNFFNDKITGYGKKIYKTGKIEEGYWKNGELKGKSGK